MQVPEAVLERFRSDHRFLITSHLNPDGDAIGTSLGIARMLRRLGKVTRIWLRDPLPAIYAPAAEGERIHFGLEPPTGHPDDFDAAIVLECPGLDRCGLEEQISALEMINIDHHLGNELYGAVNWVDSASPAVGEMVLRVAQAMKLELDSSTATALFMAVSTDTGGFRFANATERAFTAGADLVREGARPELVSRWLHESRSRASVCILGEALRTLETAHAGRVATVVVTGEMFANCSAEHSDTEGLIDFPRSIEGVEAVALIRELADGNHKVSVRSRGDVDVESVARRHGGGGHRNAAGFLLEESDLAAVRALVTSELGELFGS